MTEPLAQPRGYYEAGVVDESTGLWSPRSAANNVLLYRLGDVEALGLSGQKGGVIDTAYFGFYNFDPPYAFTPYPTIAKNQGRSRFQQYYEVDSPAANETGYLRVPINAGVVVSAGSTPGVSTGDIYRGNILRFFISTTDSLGIATGGTVPFTSGMSYIFEAALVASQSNNRQDDIVVARAWLPEPIVKDYGKQVALKWSIELPVRN